MIRVICVTDNNVKPGSLFQGEHGLCFRIETDSGCVFLDSGATSQVLSHNLDQLPTPSQPVMGVVLSHAHYDHTGGLSELLSRYPGISIFGSPNIFQFRQRFSVRNGVYNDIGMAMTQEEMQQLGKLDLSSQPQMILPEVWTTGEIPNRDEPEGRSPRHFVHQDGVYLPDPYQDDLSIVLRVSGGIVVICGCCHAGLLNTLAHVSGLFPDPILAIAGGTHLVEADDDHLQRVIRVLHDRYASPKLYVNHCTGQKATLTLTEAFPGLVEPCPAGTILQFE